MDDLALEMAALQLPDVWGAMISWHFRNSHRAQTPEERAESQREAGKRSMAAFRAREPEKARANGLKAEKSYAARKKEAGFRKVRGRWIR